ncbi:phosphatase PAP2 family protein [Microbulbifer hainanensis]|uniref:phosphatase PAP2 family protein n=1 Tax=Microbulbifer hainanensis TaxID=2735675 RepID=UPI0018685F3E|nr:phosphatase PAP2 family protein [Microbulbifer hainanensis]
MRTKTYWYAVLLCVAIPIPSEPAFAKGESSGEKLGDLLQMMIPATAYSMTYFNRDPEGRNQFYKSLATNLGITYSLKYAINKPRPENNGDYSFPSGHTSSAFQGAAFIHKRYGLTEAIPAYLAATYVAYSRVKAKKHDVVDVTAGAAVGIFSAFHFTTPRGGVEITPLVGRDFAGVSASYSW